MVKLKLMGTVVFCCCVYFFYLSLQVTQTAPLHFSGTCGRLSKLISWSETEAQSAVFRYGDTTRPNRGARLNKELTDDPPFFLLQSKWQIGSMTCRRPLTDLLVGLATTREAAKCPQPFMLRTTSTSPTHPWRELVQCQSAPGVTRPRVATVAVGRRLTKVQWTARMVWRTLGTSTSPRVQ